MKISKLRYILLIIIYLLPMIISVLWSIKFETPIDTNFSNPGREKIKDFRGAVIIGCYVEAVWLIFVTVFIAEPLLKIGM